MDKWRKGNLISLYVIVAGPLALPLASGQWICIKTIWHNWIDNDYVCLLSPPIFCVFDQVEAWITSPPDKACPGGCLTPVGRSYFYSVDKSGFLSSLLSNYEVTFCFLSVEDWPLLI